METLSIIAYRQPITRSQIESIRGVSADGPIDKLLELELIGATPNDTLPGRPMMFSTTAKFLEQCGVRSLEELPQSEDNENDRLREYFQKQEQEAAQEKLDLEAPVAAETPAEVAEQVAVQTEEPVVAAEAEKQDA
jgi:segregation and condensation protein B